jgi:hypothetical protein
MMNFYKQDSLKLIDMININDPDFVSLLKKWEKQHEFPRGSSEKIIDKCRKNSLYFRFKLLMSDN